MKKLLKIISVILVSSVLLVGSLLSYPEEVLGAWYNASWTYRVKITIQSSQVDADLTDFPIYVDLSDLPANFHTNVNQTDARDIRVTKSDGTTEVPREVVFYTSGSDMGELHFKADGTLSSSSNTDFYIYYGNAGASDYAIDATYGAENVWDSNYKGVWHMEDANPGTAVLDSTSNDNDLSDVGSMTSDDSAAAKLGKGFSFDGNDGLTINSSIVTAYPFTLEGWGDSGTAHTFASITSIFATAVYYRITSSTADKGQMGARDGGVEGFIKGTTDISSGFHHLSGVFTSSTATELFVNGSSEGTDTTSVSFPAGSDTFSIGYVARVGSAAYLVGQLDEIRISSIDRASGWISTQYTNQNTSTTFYAVANQETDSTKEGEIALKGGGEIELKGGGEIIIK